MIDLDHLADEIYATSSQKGFGDVDYDTAVLATFIGLAQGEGHEAIEQLREGHDPQTIYFDEASSHPNKPEGVPIELADMVIRILDTCRRFDIDIVDAIRIKMAYNQGRLPKHGREF